MQRVEKDTMSAIVWHQQAIGYIKQQEWQKAIAACKNAIQLQPDLAAAYKTLGVVMQLQGELEEAKQCYTKAIEIQPNLAEAHANLGSLYATQQQWHNAIASYQTALDFQPNCAGFYRNLAKVFTQINQIEKAIDSQYHAFCLEPEQVAVGESLSLAEQLLQHNQVEKAIKIYSTLVTFYPDHAPIYYHWGKALSQQEKWQEAIVSYRKAIKINPNLSHVYNSLGDALTQVQQWQDVIASYTQAIQLHPELCWSYFKLGDVWIEQQQWQNAIFRYRQGLKLNPTHYWPYLKLGEALSQNGEIQEAIATYDQAIKINPDLATAYYKLGELFQQQQQWNEAISYYQKAIKIDPNLSFIYKNLGELLQQQQKWDDLISLYRQAVQVFPDSCEIYYQLGDALRRQQQWYDAIAALMKALELKTDSFAAYDLLANTFDEQGYPDAANVCRHYRLLPPTVIQTFCNYSNDQIIALDAASDVKTIRIYPARQLQCVPPITSSENLDESFQSLSFESSPAFVSIVPNGRVIADPILTSGVFNSQDQLIPELSSGHPEFFLSSSQLPPVCELDQNLAFLSVRWGNGGYFHWMFDVVARINLIQKISEDINPIDQVVVNHCPHPYQKETLERVGISSDKIIESLHTPHIKAKKIIVPNILQEYGISQWKCELLRQAFLHPENPPNIPKFKRIYINRNQAPYRKTLNNQAVIQLLEKYGFQSLCLESLSVIEQAAYLNQAEIVVAPHGAGLTNLTFCQPGTPVIEILSPGYITPLYWFLSNICGLEHYILFGEKLPQDDNPKVNPVTRDILVNLQQLEHLLKRAGL